MTDHSVTQRAQQPIGGVIEIRHNKPMVSSLKIAELFERQHKDVLRVLRDLSVTTDSETKKSDGAKRQVPPREHGKRGRGRKTEDSAAVLVGNITWGTYRSERGKKYPIAWLDERSALIAMPFIGGRNAKIGQRKLVDAYLWYRDNFANPPRYDILAEKRAAHHPMMDALIECREEQGKTTEPHHYMCENKLCNAIVVGKFAKLDERALSNEQADLLTKVRRRNESLLVAGIDYPTRKAKLAAYAARERAKCPRLEPTA